MRPSQRREVRCERRVCECECECGCGRGCGCGCGYGRYGTKVAGGVMDRLPTRDLGDLGYLDCDCVGWRLATWDGQSSAAC